VSDVAQEVILDSRLRLVFETGMDEKGQPIYKTKTYGNIRKTATADELLQAGQALGGLCANPLVGIERADSVDIVE
jgi:hypothetical protein